MSFLTGKKELLWTKHSKIKMKFYKLSEQRVKRVLNSPKRIEEGIAPNTIALMQPISVKTSAGKASWNQEIWIMVQETKTHKKIISAWRYPGRTSPRSEIVVDSIRKAFDEFLTSNPE